MSDERQARSRGNSPPDRGAELSDCDIQRRREDGEIRSDIGCRIEPLLLAHRHRAHHRAARSGDFQPIFLALLTEQDFGRFPAIRADAATPYPRQHHIASEPSRSQVDRRKRQLCTQASDLLARHDAVFRAVGAGKPPDPLVNFEFPDWSEAHEVELIQGMDIGIMPLEDSPFARGKCGYKLIQYMACGLPVVASPVGVNSKLVTHGENGFLASTEAEWRAAIERLLSDPELRRRMGAAGRAKVESDYSIQTYGPKVAGMFASL
ncbi:MAG: glycosyltransferase family 4 protein [Mesorhizobium sp.]|nr:glycosyltransferase family 4 protein [Mesorhizobium sp.]